MPRNSLLNGKAAPDTGGDQLDETAYPILMAYLSGLGGDAALYTDHVMPAADFLVAHGPSDGVERWEEQSGYSPSTIAAEIAGLTAAAAIAAQHHDAAAARLYQATADDFPRNVKSWTVTTTGPYSAAPTSSGCPRPATRTRRSPTTSATAARPPPSTRSIDGGFLELARLGEPRRADAVVQALALGRSTPPSRVRRPSGTGFYRYGTNAANGSADGYGDCSPADSQTSLHHQRPAVAADRHAAPGTCGRCSSGERGEYDVAAGDPSAGRSAALSHDQLRLRRGPGARAGVGGPGPGGLAVRHRPGHRVDRLHRRPGGRLGVAR